MIPADEILIARATLLDDSGDRLTAWAEKHVRKDPQLAWILGNFVEADNANSNGHIFPLDDLRDYSVATIEHKPLNMLHHEQYIIGAYAGGELLFPTGEAADDNSTIVEALSFMWKHIFHEEFALVQRAQKEGALFYSMEASAQELTFVDFDNKRVPYMGRTHESYPTKDLKAKRILHKPHFGGGAIIIPPVRPGWTHADIKQLDALVKERPELAESLYDGFQAEAPHLDAKTWEALMLKVMDQARDFSPEDRKKKAKSGVAMPDGSFPIPDKDALRRAIRLAGNAKNPAAAKAHIRKRAKALGAEDMIPDTW